MNTIAGYILRREIIATLSAMGNRRFEFKFVGSRAYTDGKQIVLPEIRPLCLYPENDAMILRGYGNHEVFHPLYSSLDQRQPWIEGVIGRSASAMDDAQKHRMRVFRKTENCVEDWRIECIGGQEYPGSHINIGYTRNHIMMRELDALRKYGAQYAPYLVRNVHQVLTWFGTVENRYPCAALAAEAIAFMRKHIDPEAVAIVERYWPRFLGARSNPDIYPLALKLTDLILELDQKRKREIQRTRQADAGSLSSSQGTPHPGADQEPADAGDAVASMPTSPADRGNVADKPQGPGPGSAPDPLPGTADAPTSPGSAAGGPGAEEAGARDGLDLPALDIGDVLKRIADLTKQDLAAYKKAVADAGKAKALPHHYHSAFSAPSLISVLDKEPVDEAAFKTIMDQASREASTLTTAVRSLLLSRHRKVIRRNRLDGDLDDRNIMGIAMGEPDVFCRRLRRTGTSAAVQFQLDLSRSMLACDEDTSGIAKGARTRDTRLDILLRATGSVLEAIGHQKQIDVAIDSFSTDQELRPVIIRHKAFGEPPSRTRPALGSVLRRSFGGTPTAEAVIEGIHQLFRLRHSKRVLILVTDGEANDPIAAEQAAAVAISSGIVLIGIGIGKEAPSMNIPGWLVINDVHELPTQLLEAVRRFI